MTLDKSAIGQFNLFLPAIGDKLPSYTFRQMELDSLQL